MKTIDHLHYKPYIDEKKAEKILQKIMKRKVVPNIHVIICRTKNQNLLEVMSTRELYRLMKREDEVILVGLANERDEAFEIIERIIQEIILHGKTLDKSGVLEELGI